MGQMRDIDNKTCSIPDIIEVIKKTNIHLSRKCTNVAVKFIQNVKFCKILKCKIKYKSILKCDWDKFSKH